MEKKETLKGFWIVNAKPAAPISKSNNSEFCCLLGGTNNQLIDIARHFNALEKLKKEKEELLTKSK